MKKYSNDHKYWNDYLNLCSVCYCLDLFGPKSSLADPTHPHTLRLPCLVFPQQLQLSKFALFSCLHTSCMEIAVLS